jgi:phenylpyruvate tautomerase PptA (4-oxalocrotonate tautomerase family)
LGRNNTKKRKTTEGITKFFEDMGVPKEAVHIVIYEASKSNWGNRRKTTFRKTHPNTFTISHCHSIIMSQNIVCQNFFCSSIEHFAFYESVRSN